MKKRFLLLSIAFLAVICITALVDVGFAWTFVSSMTHPGCQQPVLLDEFPVPQEYWLDTQDGIKIRIWYYPSQNGAAILAFGGVSGSLGIRTSTVIPLIRAGYGVVQVDSRACADPATVVTLGGDEIYDAEAALQFLFSRPEVDPERIGALGFSMGGGTAIRAAARHLQIRAVLRDGGYANLGEVLNPPGSTSIQKRIYRSTVELVFRLQTGLDPWQISPIDDLPALSPRPIYLIYGEHEVSDGMEQYEAALEPKTLWVVPGGSHGRNFITAPDEYETRLLAFFDAALKK